MNLDIHKQGDELVLRLPDRLVAELGWMPGDQVVAKVDGHSLTLIRKQTRGEDLEEIVDKMMDQYGETFRALAKS